MRRLFLIFFVLVISLASSGQIVIRRYSSVTPPVNTLLTGLVAFWNLDEESGTRDDAISTNDLTDYNTTGYATGKISNAALFVNANDEALYHADNAELSLGADVTFTVAFWFNPTAVNITQTLIGKENGFKIFASQWKLVVETYDGSHWCPVASAAYVDRLENGVWKFVVGWYNATTDSVYIQVNSKFIGQTYAYSGAQDNSSNWYVGTTGTDGAIDLCGLWKGRCPVYTDGYAMADSIYNSGAGWQP